VCTVCTQTPCAAGETRTACGGIDYEDSTCIQCGIFPGNSTAVSQCVWICNEGFYKKNQECIACSTTSDDCSITNHITRDICRAGKSFTNAECKCMSGHELSRGNAGSKCAKCENYEYNREIGGTCSNCPAGQQGSGNNGEQSVSCEACPINFYKNDTMTKCEFCSAGTNSQTGTKTCHVCDPGSKMTISDEWSGFLWNYNNGQWVYYTGSTNIERNSLDGTHKFFDSQDATVAQSEIYWLDDCDFNCIGRNNKEEGTQRLYKQPQYPVICVNCVAGEIFIR